jgi:hypothetical protein
MADPARTSSFCAICQTAIEPGEAAQACPSCHSVYHSECWQENSGCAIYGCPGVPKTEGRQGLEVAPSYWGQESKSCPACGQTIMAAAIRCRHCGATFESGRPVGAEQYREERRMRSQLPSTRRTATALFVFSLLPCTAPFAAVFGEVWRQGHQREVAALPPLYSGLVRLGLRIAQFQALAGIIAVVVYAFFGGHR